MPPEAASATIAASVHHPEEIAASFVAGDPSPLEFADIHPAWCAGYGVAGKWRALGASVIGPSHVRRYRSRDDAFVLMGANGYLLAAVADGVGGQMYSRIGAAHCVHMLCREVLGRICVPHVRRYGVDDFDPATLTRELLSRGVSRELPPLASRSFDDGPAQRLAGWQQSGSYRWNWQPYRRPFPTDLYEDDDPPPQPPALGQAIADAYEATHSSLHALAGERKLRPIQLTCTLLLVAVDGSTGSAVVAGVGDGAILRLDDLRPVLPDPPSTPEGNPFTMALENWRDGLAIAESTATGWILVTDGALDFFPDAGADCRTLLTTGASASAGPAGTSIALLEWLQGLVKEGCGDDRTLASIAYGAAGW